MDYGPRGVVQIAQDCNSISRSKQGSYNVRQTRVQTRARGSVVVTDSRIGGEIIVVESIDCFFGNRDGHH